MQASPARFAQRSVKRRRKPKFALRSKDRDNGAYVSAFGNTDCVSKAGVNVWEFYSETDVHIAVAELVQHLFRL